MNRKYIYVFLIICILFCLIIFFKSSKSVEIEKQEKEREIFYDEKNEVYYILDSEGEILKSSKIKDELYIYSINPDYNPISEEVSNVESNNCVVEN